MMADPEDTRLKWPFRILIAGSSGSGKSTLMVKLVERADEAMTRTPTRIHLFFAHMQDAYVRLSEVAPCPVQLHEGGPSEDFSTPPGTLVIIDDLQATHAPIVSAWFTRKSHHMDSSVMYLVQNVFDKSPHHRTISLNATYIVLFKNPRDASQVSHLDRQVYPGGDGLLTRAYRAVTRDRPHAYIVADFNQSTPELYRLRNTLFPLEDFPHAYAFVQD